MPWNGLISETERFDMSYDLAKFYIQLHGEAYETPEAFIETFLEAHQKITQSLPSEF